MRFFDILYGGEHHPPGVQYGGVLLHEGVDIVSLRNSMFTIARFNVYKYEFMRYVSVVLEFNIFSGDLLIRIEVYF